MKNLSRGRFNRSNLISVNLIFAMTAIFFTGCVAGVTNLADDVQNNLKPIKIVDKNKIVENSQKNNEKIFKDFAKMIEGYYGKDEILITSDSEKNKELIMSAILKIGKPLVYVDLQNQTQKVEYVISGSITELDEGVKIVDNSLTAGIQGLLKEFAGDLQGENRKNTVVTNMAVDMYLKDYETSKLIANSIQKASLYQNQQTRTAGFYLFGTGLEVADSVTYRTAKDATVRSLIEIGTLEIIGKELKLPYWKLTKAKESKFLVSSIEENFEKSDKIRELQKILQKYGFSDVEINGNEDSKTKENLKRVTESFNLRYSGVSARLLTDLWLNIPYQKGAKYTPNGNLLHYPNDIVVVAKQIDRLGFSQVRINSIVNRYTRNRNSFSDEFKNRLVDYLTKNTSLKVIDSSKDSTRKISRRNKGLVDINGFFELDDKKIVMEFKAIDGEKVVKTIKEDFSKNGLTDTSLSSSKIANYLKIKTEKRDDTIEVMANKGELDTIYYGGEKITFEVRLKKPMYLYIFNIDSNGKVSDLTDSVEIYEQGKIYTIPAPDSNWEMPVEKPYGNEGIKFIALSEKIDFPKDKSANEIVDYFRNQAQNRGFKIYEKSLLIQTKEK